VTDLNQILREQCYGKDLEQRKTWYSPAAEAYNQVRPRYPQALIDRVINMTQLSAQSQILEIGCGPGVATPAFAAIGCSMLCLEPNSDFTRLAQQNCQPYPNVTIQNCSFEEWQQSGQFDAVLAASSFHWVSPEVGYPKVAAALRPGGHFILLWNKELTPSYEIYQQLTPVYEQYAPSLIRPYEDSAAQAAILDELGGMAIVSGHFEDLQTANLEVKVTYSIGQYLLLLNTYSPHLKLEPQQRQNLFEGLRRVLGQYGDTVQLSYVSAFHIVRPKKIAYGK
jgi:SAM-dependent methyltransferase